MSESRVRLGEFSIPNLLSYFRLILVPAFVVVFFSDFANHRPLAGIILVISGLTDILDGLIARRYHMVTELGKLLDPFADKVTQATICICLVIGKVAPFWLLLIFVVKEILMVAGGAKMLRSKRVIMPSRWYGKLATVVFYIVMVSIISFEISWNLAIVLILIVLLFMLFAFAMYLRIFLRLSAGSHADRKA